MTGAKISKILPGFAFAVLIGLGSWFVSLLSSSLSPLVLGIVVGMIARTIIGERTLLMPGLDKAVKIFIPLGIILYGTHLEFHRLAEVPTYVWIQLLVSIIIIILIVHKLGPKLRLNKAVSLLIGVGTAICGASAIVLTAPVVEAEAEDTAKSLVVITLFGLVGVILWPFMGSWLGLSSDTYALFCATTLHQTGMVKTAAASLGPESLDTAMIIKMARIASIIPLILLVGVLSKFRTLDEAAESKKPFDIRIPWFLWGFIFVGLIFSYITPLANNVQYIQPLAGVVWTMAMVSIGLTVDIRRIASSLPLPLLLGLIAWLSAIAIFMIGFIASV